MPKRSRKSEDFSSIYHLIEILRHKEDEIMEGEK